jgi:hypothetical protein
MKARLILALLALAACNDPGGILIPFTDTTGSATAGTRAVAVRGVVSGAGGQLITGATVRITATPVDLNNLCQGTATQVTAITGATGEYRAQVRVPEQSLNLCVIATVTPPVGSTFRATTLDLGRVAPVLATNGAVVPELLANFQLTR